jgi:hypothetical protein
MMAVTPPTYVDLVTPIHQGWVALCEALRVSGVAPDLDLDTVVEGLGDRATHRPEVDDVSRVVLEYFDGHGDPSLGWLRRRRARLVSLAEGHRATAHDVVSRLALAVPEVEELFLAADHVTDTLTLWGDGVATFVDASEVIVTRVAPGGAPHRRRDVTVRGLVAATNRLLALLGRDLRFVPLASSDGVEVYVGASAVDTTILEAGNLLEGTTAELSDLTSWNVGRRPRLRSVA